MIVEFRPTITDVTPAEREAFEKLEWVEIKSLMPAPLRTPFLATQRGGIWSVWRVVGKNVLFVTSALKLDEALDFAAMRKGTPAPLAAEYPLERLRTL